MRGNYNAFDVAKFPQRQSPMIVKIEEVIARHFGARMAIIFPTFFSTMLSKRETI